MHVSKQGRGTKSRKMHLAVAEDLKFMDSFGIADPSVQIFVTGPKTFRETLKDDEKLAIRQYVDRTGTKLVIHGAYVDRPWGGIAGAVHNVKQELRIGAAIGATGVIVHLSAGCADDAALRAALTELSNIDVQQILWLEIHAAKASEFTYETPAKLRRLFARIEGFGLPAGPLQIGLCIDTAHLYACGTSLETFESARTWIEEVCAIKMNGVAIPIMMHLNDSLSALGSGIDRHAPLCEGTIWNTYHPTRGRLPFERSGLNYILEWVDSSSVVTILERDDSDLHKDLKLVHELGFYTK
jgi:endonuclease IV